MNELKNEKWYNMQMLVDVLLFIFPPLGLYAVYKTDKLKSKLNRVVYSLFGVVSFLSAALYMLN